MSEEQKNSAPLASEEPSQKKKEPFSLGGELYTWLQALSFALVLLVVIFTFFGRIIGVDGESMVPTLQDRDMLLLQCVGYEPAQGDVVVLHKDFATVTDPIVKRVIAVGGQTVDVDYSRGEVLVDGEAIDQSYLGEPMVDTGNPYMMKTHWEVPEGSVFVMGDNRNNSSDSRDERLGVVDNRYVLGKVMRIIFPLSHIGGVENVH